MRAEKLVAAVLVTLAFVISTTTVGAVNFTQCLETVRSYDWIKVHGTDGGTDNSGKRIPLTNDTTSITYELCINACGSGPESFQWSVFSKEFAAWLLPWLALVSQLPFGAEGMWDDLVGVILVVGSPMLAAYSLAFSVLNGYWLARHLRSRAGHHRNTSDAIHVLHNLQRFPVKVIPRLLPSLIENDEWWQYLGQRLAGSGTWSFSAVSNVAWVAVAYLFTVADSLTGGLGESINANGQGVGSVWFWLLPIVIGWLQILSKNAFEEDVETANTNHPSRVRTTVHSPGPSTSQSSYQPSTTSPQEEHPLSIIFNLDDSFVCEASRTVPVFNYIRFFSWIRLVDTVATAFEQRHPHRQEASESRAPLLSSGSANEKTPGQIHRTWIDFRVFSRMFIASGLGLFLQWGTVGAAVIIVWYTPTIGLGCRSLAYILYGAVSTIVWLMLMISSVLYHYAETAPSDCLSLKRVRAARILSIFLRRLGKTLAALNAIGIVLLCVFQFANFYDRCWCNSSVLWWGESHAFNVLKLTNDDIHGLRGVWIGGFFLAAGSAGIFVTMTSIFKLSQRQRFM